MAKPCTVEVSHRQLPFPVQVLPPCEVARHLSGLAMRRPDSHDMSEAHWDALADHGLVSYDFADITRSGRQWLRAYRSHHRQPARPPARHHR